MGPYITLDGDWGYGKPETVVATLAEQSHFLCKACNKDTEKEPAYSAKIILEARERRICPTCKATGSDLLDTTEADDGRFWVPHAFTIVRLYCWTCKEQEILTGGQRLKCSHCQDELSWVPNGHPDVFWLALFGLQSAMKQEDWFSACHAKEERRPL